MSRHTTVTIQPRIMKSFQAVSPWSSNLPVWLEVSSQLRVTDETGDDALTTPPPITFTLYSVKYQSGVIGNDNTTTLEGDGVEDASDNDVRPLGSYFTFPGAEVPVPLFS